MNDDASCSTTLFYGKYRGTVLNNLDPENRGRIIAKVPGVLGDFPSSWAIPCLPSAGDSSGLFTVPPVNAGVWIEFEGGNADFPVWVGGFWGSAPERPKLSQAVPPGMAGMTLETPNGNGIVISDAPGAGVLLKFNSGPSILLSDAGIVIDNGRGAKIELSGPTVTINGGALEVT